MISLAIEEIQATPYVTYSKQIQTAPYNIIHVQTVPYNIIHVQAVLYKLSSTALYNLNISNSSNTEHYRSIIQNKLNS